MRALFLYALFLALLTQPGFCRRTPDYTAADRHASAATPEVERTVASLGRYLRNDRKLVVWNPLVKFYTKDPVANREVAREIFIWIASRIAYREPGRKTYGVKAYSKEVVPNSTLRTRVAWCDGYSKLFMELADETGLQVQYIFGFVAGGKGHAWNSINFGDEWRMVDCTWGRRGENGELRPEWFDVAPRTFLETHYPYPGSFHAYSCYDFMKTLNRQELRQIQHRLMPPGENP